MFGDEVGTDTNQIDYGNNGGQRYIGIKGMETNLLLSTASIVFTLMGLTSGTDKPLLCICILAAQSLSVTDFKGFGYRTYIPHDSSKTMEENMGERKALPGFPVCKFRGKLITGLMCMSPKVSISSYILTEALKYLDLIYFFEWNQDVPSLFVLLDGHGSRLQLPSLKYINSTTPNGLRKWIQTLRNTNATYGWQVGNSSNQNV